MGKHAYLIIAHNEYTILQQLVSALDNTNNDIYIHIDKKSRELPKLYSEQSNLVLLDNRINVYWGTSKQILTETLILKTAFESGIIYDYYHIISGIHYPIKPLSEINSVFESLRGYSVFQPLDDSEGNRKKRLGRYHLFLRYYTSPNKLIWHTYRFIWRGLIKCQEILGIERDYSYYGGKTSNWCTLSRDAVEKWIEDEEKIARRFRYTYCADEYVAMSVIKEHGLPYVFIDSLLFQQFINGNPRVLDMEDYEALLDSPCLFARKFSQKSIELIQRLKKCVSYEPL